MPSGCQGSIEPLTNKTLLDCSDRVIQLTKDYIVILLPTKPIVSFNDACLHGVNVRVKLVLAITRVVVNGVALCNITEW